MKVIRFLIDWPILSAVSLRGPSLCELFSHSKWMTFKAYSNIFTKNRHLQTKEKYLFMISIIFRSLHAISLNFIQKVEIISGNKFCLVPKISIIRQSFFRITHADTLHLAHVGGEMFDFQPRAL